MTLTAVLKKNEISEEAKYLNILREKFHQQGHVNITRLLDKELFKRLSAEAQKLVSQYKERRDLLMEETSFSPRKMFVVKQMYIKKYGRYIPELYHSRHIQFLISQIVSQKIYALPWEREQYLISQMANKDDTHGWHLDDYTYAVVFIIRSPKLENGGLVQCVPNVRWTKNNIFVNKILCENPIYTSYFGCNEAYLLKSDTTLHRVTPLERPDSRIIINMSWAIQSDFKKDITHSTMEKLY